MSDESIHCKPKILIKGFYTSPQGESIPFTLNGETDLELSELEALGIFKEPDHGGNT